MRNRADRTDGILDTMGTTVAAILVAFGLVACGGDGNECTGPNCVCVGVDPCAFGCPGGDACNIECAAGTCNLGCSSTDVCNVECSGSTTCTVDCANGPACNIRCSETQCTVTNCPQATCNVACGLGAQLPTRNGTTVTCP